MAGLNGSPAFSSRAVSGISCIRPIAPTRETASGSKQDSRAISALTSVASTPYSPDRRSIVGTYGAARRATTREGRFMQWMRGRGRARPDTLAGWRPVEHAPIAAVIAKVGGRQVLDMRKAHPGQREARRRQARRERLDLVGTRAERTAVERPEHRLERVVRTLGEEHRPGAPVRAGRVLGRQRAAGTAAGSADGGAARDQRTDERRRGECGGAPGARSRRHAPPAGAPSALLEPPQAALGSASPAPRSASLRCSLSSA